jgi:dTDP-4-dehydrorhamnose reductase
LLGTAVVRLASQAGHDVFSGYNLHLPPAGIPIRLNLTQLGEITPMIRKAHPDFIIHTAAVTDVDLCEQEPEVANLVNGKATGEIGEAAALLGSYVIYVSTDYVFDGKTGSYHEEDRPNPINHYGRSKLLGEELIKGSHARYCIARPSVVYGWGREHRPNFATWVIDRLRSNQSANVAVDHFASPTLNENLASMLLETASKKFEGIIHLAGATRINRYDFAVRIAATFGLNASLIRPVGSDSLNWKAKRPTDSSLDTSLAQKLLEKKPLRIEEALALLRASKPK